MLLDPAEQQFDLPAALVECRDLDRRAAHIVGDEGDEAALVTPHSDAPQGYCQAGIAPTGEHDLTIVDDAEAVALAFAQWAAFDGAQAAVHFCAGDEESPACIDLLPPTEMTITFVEDVGSAGLERHS